MQITQTTADYSQIHSTITSENIHNIGTSDDPLIHNSIILQSAENARNYYF